MSSSGTYTFSPSIGSLAQYAYGLCGIRRTELTQEHLQDAYLSANLMLASLDNLTPNLWKVDEVTVALTQGVGTVSVDSTTVTVLDAFIRTFDTQGQNQFDRIIWPISRTEYASIPNKTWQAPPTVFWWDRTLSPTIYLWQIPDQTSVYELHYYRVLQVQDASIANGQTADLPLWFLEPFAFGIAARVAIAYAPDRADRLDAKAKELLRIALDQNVETNNTLYLATNLYQYYTRR